jgi:hypothetical protein
MYTRYGAGAQERALLVLIIDIILLQESSRDTLGLNLQKALANTLEDLLR